MMAGTAFAFYTFRQAFMDRIGTPKEAQQFLAGDVAGKIDGLILDQMVTIGLVVSPVGVLFLGSPFFWPSASPVRLQGCRTASTSCPGAIWTSTSTGPTVATKSVPLPVP
jgi:hypothetical protein